MACIAVADPLPLFQAGMVAILAADGHQVESPADLVGWARTHDRGIVVITLATEPAWLLLTAVAAVGSDNFILAMLPTQDGVSGSQAVRAGAHSVLGRDASPSRLQRAVEAAVSGFAQLPVDVVRALRAAGSGPTLHQRPSPQQLSWLRSLAAGVTVTRLAELERYSERAMYRLLQRLYSQLGVRTRTEALMRAQELGWLSAADDR